MICEEKLARFSTLYTISTENNHFYRKHTLPVTGCRTVLMIDMWLDSSMLWNFPVMATLCITRRCYSPISSDTRAALHASWCCRALPATCMFRFNKIIIHHHWTAVPCGWAKTSACRIQYIGSQKHSLSLKVCGITT